MNMETSLKVGDDYEAPRVESVVNPEELEREVLYAGSVTADA